MEDKQTPWRVVVVGGGWASLNLWLPLLCAAPDFVVMGMVEPSGASRTAVSSAYPTLAMLPTIDDAIATRPDLAFIVTPNSEHAPQALRFLRESVSVFVEKPVCLTIEELDGLEVASKGTGSRLIPSQASRHRTDVLALCRLLEAGAVGSPRHLDVGWVRARGVPAPGSWRTNRRNAGGGALIDLGWHVLDPALGLAGFPPLRSVTALLGDDFCRRPEMAAGWFAQNCRDAVVADVEDTAVGLAELEGSLGLTFRFAWASHDSPDRTWIRVDGTEGSAELTTTFGLSPNRMPNSRLELRARGLAKPIDVSPSPIGAEYAGVLDDIRDALCHRASQAETFRGLRAVLRVVAGAYDSASSRALTPLG